jgi:NADH:ubiquinone oxidoreductase subunit K
VLSDSAARRWLYPLTAAIILAWFFFFTRKSLSLYFDSDDMMNLYLAWSKPLAEVYRPVGALFYRGLFALCGFNPLPFRIACLAIGVVNMGLCWWFLRLVSGSERVVALALLLFAFHTRLMEVWWRNAVIYDLLCFTFFYLAVCHYVSARKAGRMPGWARSGAILACFLCALGAKENALALPVILLAYELLFHGVRWRNLRWPAVLAVLDLPYLYFKTHGAGAMAILVGYAPEYTGRQFLGAWGRFLGYLLVRDQDLQPWVAAFVLAALLAGAAAARSRTLTLAWLILFVAPLPVTFIAYRGGYVLYTAYPGAVLYAAVVLVAAQDFIARKHPQYRTALACAAFVLIAWRWGKLNLHDQRIDPRPWLYESAAEVHSMAGQMRGLVPQLPKGARVLFLQDGFSTGEWTPYFIVKLLYRDDTLTPDRIKMMDKKPADWNSYQYVFGFDDGRYRLMKP